MPPLHARYRAIHPCRVHTWPIFLFLPARSFPLPNYCALLMFRPPTYLPGWLLIPPTCQFTRLLFRPIDEFTRLLSRPPPTVPPASYCARLLFRSLINLPVYCCAPTSVLPYAITPVSGLPHLVHPRLGRPRLVCPVWVTRIWLAPSESPASYLTHLLSRALSN